MDIKITSHSNAGGIPVVAAPFTISGTYNGSGNRASVHIEVQFGGGPVQFVGAQAVTNGTWSVSGAPPATVRGSDTFIVTASLKGFVKDGENHNEPVMVPPASVTLRLQDVAVPVVTINGATASAPDLPAIQATQATAPFLLTGTATDADSRLAWVQVQLDTGPFENVVDGAGNNFATWSKAYTLAPGLHRFTVAAMDVGNHPALTATAYLMVRATPEWSDPGTESITSWTRLEPHCRDADMGRSVSARVFDPLWMLARQWQVGEYQGVDGGSPVQARLRATSARLSRARIGAVPNAPTVTGAPYDPTRVPLEALVERRGMRARTVLDARMLTLAVEGGLYFLRMLELQSLSKYRPGIVARFGLQMLSAPAWIAADDATQRYVETMLGRAPDARRIADMLRASDGLAQLVTDVTVNVTAADAPKVKTVATAWLAWYDALFSEPTPPATPADDAWDANRMEYSVSVAAALSAQPADQVGLSASEFDDGRFDWNSFDANAAATLGSVADRTFTSIVETTIPAPVTFRGAPAVRFWEIEDSRVAYGLAPVGTTDLAHLMAIEYASSYGNDWYTIPLTVPVGSVTRVDSLVITDTFGVRTLIRPMGAAGMPNPYFSMWQHATRHTPGTPWNAGVTRNLFFLPPALGRVIEGPPLEEVLFLRDEMANLAWAVERSIESPLEQAQSVAYAVQSNPSPQPPNATTVPHYHYHLSTTVPANWVPLLPVQQQAPGGPVVLRLKRGAVLQPDGSNVVHTARGEVLNAAPQLLLYDAEVPREGARVTRSRRMARWIDGSTWIWSAFRKSVGRGEGSSGLRFDSLDE